MLRTVVGLLIAATPIVAEDNENGKFEKFNLNARLSLLSVAAGPDGKQVAIAAGDFTLRTWNVAKGEELMQWKAHEHPAIHRVGFSNDGKAVFSCCEDGTVFQWDPTTGKEVREFKSHSVGVKSLAVSADNKQLLTAGSDATLRLFEVATGKVLHVMRIPDALVESPFRSVAISANGDRALAGNAKGHVSLWDLKTGKQVNLFSGHKGEVVAVAFLADGKEFVSGDESDSIINQWDITTGKVTRTFDGHEKGIRSLAVSPDGKRLVSASADGTVRVWEIKSGKEIYKSKEHGKPVNQAIFMGDQRVISVGEDGSLIVWHLPT